MYFYSQAIGIERKSIQGKKTTVEKLVKKIRKIESRLINGNLRPYAN